MRLTSFLTEEKDMQVYELNCVKFLRISHIMEPNIEMLPYRALKCDCKYEEYIRVDEIACKLNQTCIRLTTMGEWNLLMDSNI